MSPIGNRAAGALQFKEIRQSVNGKSSLALYEGTVNARVFVYLYLKPETCALVWRGPRSPQCNTTLPFGFLDTQFGNMPKSKIDFIERSVPLYGSAMLHKGYKLLKCLATLFLTGENGGREYDLLSSTEPEKYRRAIVEKEDALARLTFARFDSVVKHKNRRTGKDENTSYSFTFEKSVAPTAGAEWEFSIRVPRDLEFKTATLVWIARHHFAKEMLQMDFEQSLAALSEATKPQEAPVYS
jgi:hypothetical protein